LNEVLVLPEVREDRAAADGPNFHGEVVSGRRDDVAIRHIDGSDPVRMSTEGFHAIACGRIPEADATVSRAGYQLHSDSVKPATARLAEQST
jgi:hypothetical protein